MKVLIFGASGNFGPYLVKQLKSDGHHPIIVGRNISQNENLKIEEFIEVDYRKLDIESLPKDINSVIYIAQSRKFRNFPEEAEDIFTINTSIPFKLLNWCKMNKVYNFTYFSTGAVYTNDNLAPKNVNSPKISFSNNFYATTKLCAEELVQSYRDIITSLKIVRPFFLFGEYQSKDMLIPRLIESVKYGKEIQINQHGGIKINPLFSLDAARWIVPNIFKEGFEVFNLAGNREVSIKEISLMIARNLNKDPKFIKTESIESKLIGTIEASSFSDFTPLEESIKLICEKH